MNIISYSELRQQEFLAIYKSLDTKAREYSFVLPKDFLEVMTNLILEVKFVQGRKCMSLLSALTYFPKFFKSKGGYFIYDLYNLKYNRLVSSSSLLLLLAFTREDNEDISGIKLFIQEKVSAYLEEVRFSFPNYKTCGMEISLRKILNDRVNKKVPTWFFTLSPKLSSTKIMEVQHKIRNLYDGL